MAGPFVLLPLTISGWSFRPNHRLSDASR